MTLLRCQLVQIYSDVAEISVPYILVNFGDVLFYIEKCM